MTTTDPNGATLGGTASVTARLAVVIRHWTRDGEDAATPVPGLTFFRRENPTEACACLIEPSIVLVVQGAKQLLIDNRAYRHDAGRFLLASLDLPASSQVLEASPEAPCLGLALRIDMRVLTELTAQIGMPAVPDRAAEGCAVVGNVTTVLLEPFERLLGSLDDRDATGVLAPLIVREIHYRLLKSDQAARLVRMASTGSQTQRVARAIDWLKLNYTNPLHVNELATHVQMSTSNLHRRFRQLTGMSPLQYQKWLRLNEARRLMLNEKLDASSAAFKVGYESPSQFSREYRRVFGAPPKRDVTNLRRALSTG